MAVTMCDYGTLAIALNGGQDVLHNVSLTMYRNKRPTKRNNETDAFDYFPIMTRARKSPAGYCTVSSLSHSLIPANCMPVSRVCKCLRLQVDTPCNCRANICTRLIGSTLLGALFMCLCSVWWGLLGVIVKSEWRYLCAYFALVLFDNMCLSSKLELV